MRAWILALAVGCTGDKEEIVDSGEPVETTAICPDGSGDARFAALAETIEAERLALGATAMAVAVVTDGELAWCGGFGQRHPADGGTVDGETLFRMGSVNKMMTAVAVLQQVEAGELSLDAAVTETIPGFTMALDPRYTDMTGQDLLTHQGAFYDYLEIDSNHEDEALEEAVEDWFDEGMVLLAPPGVFWNYSNPNWYVAGRMVEVLDGRSYVSYMDEAVFDPLGMTRTGYDADFMLADGNYAVGETSDWTGQSAGTVYAGPDSYDNAWARPAGYAWTSARELVTFGQFLLDGDPTVLSDDLREEMLTTQVDLEILDGSFQGYGYGLFVDQGIYDNEGAWRPLGVTSHGGDINGFAADLFLVPEHGFAIAVLAAGDGAHLSDSILEAIEAFVPMPEAIEGPDLTVDPSIFSDYAGHYAEPWGITGEFSVSVGEKGELQAIFPLLDEVAIPYESELISYIPDNFIYTVQGYAMLMTFMRDDSGEVTYARTRLFVGERDADVSAQRSSQAVDPARLSALLKEQGPPLRSLSRPPLPESL
ncbi:MAG: CubicO group peptidase (beta-lactamase class C family) [Myxococcota bacterium]|jgi:CubicO group peptidase (beta-lactamase class C family)